MTEKGNELDALFAEALKAVEGIETKIQVKTNAQSEDLSSSEDVEIEFELEIEDPIEEYVESTHEEIEIELSEIHEEDEEDDETPQNFAVELASLQKEYQVLEDKAHKAMRGLKKYKRESEKISRHNELLQRELSRLNGNAQQSSRKIDQLESRRESSREALSIANQRIDQLTEGIKRQEGMIERSKKLRQKEQTQMKNFGAAPAITKILPAIDSFELALTQSSDDVATLQEGLSIALKQFHGTLDSIGVSKIASGKGVLFDPNFHEAVMRIPSEEVPHNHILECFCDAYIMNGRLLRAAKVSVAMSSQN